MKDAVGPFLFFLFLLLIPAIIRRNGSGNKGSGRTSQNDKVRFDRGDPPRLPPRRRDANGRIIPREMQGRRCSNGRNRDYRETHQ